MKHPNQAIEDILTSFAIRNPGIDLSLGRMKTLLATLGNPHETLPPVIHVAGTNGKGSLLAYLTAIFEAADYKVSRLTSPFLVTFNEEIYLAGKEISNDYLLQLLQKVHAHMKHHPATYFEATVAAAFLAFSETQADVLLLETGLGGRLDASNVVAAPMLTAITPVSIDHSEFLGDTIAAIASEKAGILKMHVPCIVGKQVQEAGDTIAVTARKLAVHLHRFGHEWHISEKQDGFFYQSQKRAINLPLPNLAGRHQIANAATAVACVDFLTSFNITDEHIAYGITHAVWQARLQRLESGHLVSLLPDNVELWLDGGHNPGAGEVLAEWIKNQKKPVHLVCGILKTKDARHIIAPIAHLVGSLTAIAIEGSKQNFPPQELVKIGQEFALISSAAENVVEAINDIVKKEKNGALILIFGSLYLAGNILLQNRSDIEE